MDEKFSNFFYSFFFTTVPFRVLKKTQKACTQCEKRERKIMNGKKTHKKEEEEEEWRKDESSSSAEETRPGISREPSSGRKEEEEEEEGHRPHRRGR